MATINSPSDATVAELRRMVWWIRERLNRIEQGQEDSSALPTRVSAAISQTPTTGTENVTNIDFQGLPFDISTEARDVSATNGGIYHKQNAYHSGFHFPTGIPVWATQVDNAWYSLAMRWGLQWWGGTTTSEIPNGGSGTVDMITSSGTLSIQAQCHFPETVGDGVLVAGAFFPDGTNRILVAACEAAGVGPVNPTP